MVDPGVLAAAATATVPGALVGLGAGLVPGLHANTVAHGLLAAPALALAPVAAAAGAASGDPGAMAAFAGFLFGMALGHAFSDDVPAVYLGAPDAETALSVLPGHRLLEAGLGQAAVRAAARGSLFGVLLCLPLVPVLAWLMGPPVNGYGAVRPFLPPVLLGLAAALVMTEHGSPAAEGLGRRDARLLAAGLLLASAALGELVMFRGLADGGFFPLGPPEIATGGPLLALFAGLFGVPTLVFSLAAAGRPLEEPPPERPDVIDGRDTRRFAALGTAAGALVGWLPGVGAAQATTLAFAAADRLRLRSVGRQGSPRDAATFLVAASAVGTANLLFNLVALTVLLRERSGVMVAVHEAAGPVVDGAAATDLLVGLLVGAVACLPLCYGGAVGAGRVAAGLYRRFGPRRMALVALAVIVGFVFVLEGTTGLFVLGLATALGLVPPAAGVKRVHLMGCVLLPVSLRLAGL